MTFKRELKLRVSAFLFKPSSGCNVVGYFNIQFLVKRPGYGPEVLGFDSRQGKRFCLQIVRSRVGTHAAFCSVGTGPSLPGCKKGGA